MQRIGVFICHCGTNIAATVDVKAVAEALSHEPGVVLPQTISTCVPNRDSPSSGMPLRSIS